MTILEILHETERRFWDLTIPLLESKDPIMKKFILLGYSFYQRYRPMNFLAKSAFWACLGMTFGLAIGIITR
jgi:hypothetical protein